MFVLHLSMKKFDWNCSFKFLNGKYFVTQFVIMFVLTMHDEVGWL